MTTSALVKRFNQCAPTNWKHGRTWVSNGRGTVDCMTVHVTEGSASSVRAWFAESRESGTSAHYMVTLDGVVESFVGEDDTAYHAGQLNAPSNTLVQLRYANGGYTPNGYAIGIEHEGDGEHELTGAQRKASVLLMWDIHDRRGVPIDRSHIFGHHEVKASKTCPGKISVDRLVAELLAFAGSSTMPTAPVLTPSPVVPVPDVANIPPVVFSARLGWVVPITVTSDTVWTFARVDELRAAIKAGKVATTYEAGTPLSSMPRTRPGA